MDSSRIKTLQSQIHNPILIKKPENLYYLTGRPFELEAEEYLLVNSRRKNTDKRRIHADVVAFGGGLEKITWARKVDRLKYVGKYLKGQKKLQIENVFTFAEYDYLRAKCAGPDIKVKISHTKSPVDFQRQIKEPGEIALVKKSMQIVEAVFKQVRKEIKKPQMTEAGLARFIQKTGLRLGAEDVSFPAIVASGANAAAPHHLPANKKLKAGESILLDFGFKYKNYCSDFTRTVFLKKVHPKLEVAYNQVEKAYNECIKFCGSLPIYRPAQSPIRQATTKYLLAGQVYNRAVEVLAEKKLDKYFIHSLGHGSGLEIHELPNLSPDSRDVMQNGMVFSIEPGVYLPRLGGIRIEDLVFLENDKVRKFIQVPTALAENIL